MPPQQTILGILCVGGQVLVKLVTDPTVLGGMLGKLLKMLFSGNGCSSADKVDQKIKQEQRLNALTLSLEPSEALLSLLVPLPTPAEEAYNQNE